MIHDYLIYFKFSKDNAQNIYDSAYNFQNAKEDELQRLKQRLESLESKQNNLALIQNELA